jgi:RNA recognition motif-containing protein
MQLLYDTFSAFGVIVNTPKIMRDPDTGNSKGFGFVSYDCFEASDAAIEAMNGQYLCNRQITVSYAYKKDTKGEEQLSSRAGCSMIISTPLLLVKLHWQTDVPVALTSLVQLAIPCWSCVVCATV